MDESRICPPHPDFHCSERSERNDPEDVVSSVIFRCHLRLPPDGEGHRLEFVCREPSCGALLPTETDLVLHEGCDEAPVDPHFFDDGYTLAGRTGFQVWTGTRILVETLVVSHDDDDDHNFPRLRYWRDRIRGGTNILELGAGVGVVGCALASAGAAVLLTDLPTLVEHSVQPNVERNRETSSSESTRNPSQDQSDKSAATTISSVCPTWLHPQGGGVNIGRGRAAASPIDWKQPLEEQLSREQGEQVDLIVASDCVFLVEMLKSLLDTVASVFEWSCARRQPSLLLSFQRRDAKDGDESQSFTTVNRVISEVRKRHWSIECLAWRPVVVGEDKSEVFVFEILPNA